MENGTLHSRLRVLVAKTFRAEKLYTSIRNTNAAKLSQLSSLSEIANDIRAKEWQKGHHELRTTLNDILSLGSSSQMTAEIFALRDRFALRCREESVQVEEGLKALKEAADRHEFAVVLKLSVELVRYKARAQASKTIADELTGVLQASGRTEAPLVANAPMPQVEEPLSSQPKVVPLRRKVS